MTGLTNVFEEQADGVDTHAATHYAGGSDPIDLAKLGAIPASEKGKAGGVATLGVDGKVPSGQLPLDDLSAQKPEANDVFYDASASGLIADNVQDAIDTVLLKMYAGEGLIVKATVLTDSGDPVEGAIIEGLYNSIRETCVTNADGTVLGFTLSPKLTLTATGFYDLEDSTLDVSGNIRDEVSVTFTMVKRNFVSIETSQTKKFSAFCKRVDVTVVGGGAGGAYAPKEESSASLYGGSGGGGGQVIVRENLSFVAMVDYTATIGAGGKAGTSCSTAGLPGKGGTTTFLEVSAEGGNAAIMTTVSNRTAWTVPADVGGGAGGAGAVYGGIDASDREYNIRNAGKGGDCTVQGFTSFTTTGEFSGGGGGGAFGAVKISGGSPYGGCSGYWKSNSQGSEQYLAGEDGKGPGGGGGGGVRQRYSGGTAGGNGHRGVVNIRMWFEEDLTS